MSQSYLVRRLPLTAAPGPLNMAIDEAVLQHCASGDAPTLRWYQWSEPTLSLGYFQRWEERPASLRPLTTVRRLTGGGAIIHDQELTYSLVVPTEHQAGRTPSSFVAVMHASIRAALGAADELRLADARPEAEQRFLCFERRSPTDVVYGPRKIVGSAQRARRGALLQHGSILLSASAAAPHLHGWSEANTDVSVSDLMQRIEHELTDRMGWTFVSGTLRSDEIRYADELCATKYCHPMWNERR